MRTFLKSVYFIFLLIGITVIEIHAQDNTAVDWKELDTYFENMVSEWDLPSASIGIVKEGKLVFSGNYGYMDLEKKQKPDENTLYAIASNSKAFTSAIIGMLVQEGKLDWNDPVKKYLPYFALYDPWVSDHTTIRDILSHRVGLGTFSGDNIWYKTTLSSKDMIKRIQYVPKAYDFRAGYGYSNLMYITAGEIIKTLTGKGWSENVKEKILLPLGMTRSISSIEQLDIKGNFAQPYARKDGGNYKIPWVDWDEVAATGGLISSVNDLAKWMIFNMDNGILGKDTLLSKSTRNMVWTPHNNRMVDHTKPNDFNRHFNAYGLGWGLSDYHGRLKVGHTGGYDGMISAITLIPDEKIGVVVLTNGVKSPIMAATYYALDKMLGLETKDWSKTELKRVDANKLKDTRISDRISKRVLNTKPTIAVQDMVGSYESKLVGKILIEKKDDKLLLIFENAPLLKAELSHWHYDVWKINWLEPQAWFSFGTIKVNADNNLNVLGFDFDVPNNDFFFEELKPVKSK